MAADTNLTADHWKWRTGGGGVTTKKNKTWSPRRRPSASWWPRGANATGKCCEINSHSAFKSERSAAAREKGMRLQSRVKLHRLKCECSSTRACVCMKETDIFYSKLSLITSLGMKCNGINYAHSPSRCSALRKQDSHCLLLTNALQRAWIIAKGATPACRALIFMRALFFFGCVNFLSGTLRWLGCLVFLFFCKTMFCVCFCVCVCVCFSWLDWRQSNQCRRKGCEGSLKAFVVELRSWVWRIDRPSKQNISWRRST